MDRDALLREAMDLICKAGNPYKSIEGFEEFENQVSDLSP